MLQFIKNWTLPLAMLVGVIGYFCFAAFDFLTPTKPVVKVMIAWLTPFLIFAQLLLTFCKVEVKELVPQRWTIWLLLIQFVSCVIIASLLIFLPLDEYWSVALQGTMVCLICPTATAAAVITGKLGGSAASLTTYTLLSNLLAAVIVPLVFRWSSLRTWLSVNLSFVFWARSSRCCCSLSLRLCCCAASVRRFIAFW